MTNVPFAGAPIAGPNPPAPDWFRFFNDLKRDVDGKAGNGVLVDIQLITASGTYTKDADTNSVLVIGQAAGGGGGGVGTTSGTGRSGHGGVGETRWGVFAITGNVTVTIGAAGTGASAGNNSGGTASDATFGSLMTCKGGTGGGGSTGANNGTNGSTPSGSGGIAIPNTGGAINTSSAAFKNATGLFDSGYSVAGGSTFVGFSASGVGGGGMGSIDTGTTARAGGNGAAGMFIVIGFR